MVMTITDERYRHLPSGVHQLVVDALVERGEWRRVKTPVEKGKRGEMMVHFGCLHVNSPGGM